MNRDNHPQERRQQRNPDWKGLAAFAAGALPAAYFTFGSTLAWCLVASLGSGYVTRDVAFPNTYGPIRDLVRSMSELFQGSNHTSGVQNSDDDSDTEHNAAYVESANSR